MRFFTAPALAGNVDATATTKLKTAQTKAREFVKDQLESLGAERYVPPLGVVIPKLNLLDRDFRPDLVPPGQISPRRGSVVNQPEAESLWDAA